MFVVSISAGLIAFNYPLEVEPHSMIRNLLFYLVSVLWLTFMLWDGVIKLGESIGFIGLYALYVFVVWISHRWKKNKKRTRIIEGTFGLEYVGVFGELGLCKHTHVRAFVCV